jgi:monothiol glutaredoxin
MPRQINDEITATLKDNPVVLFMKGTRRAPQCGFSAAVISCLEEVGVPYKEIDVLADAEVRAGIKEFSDWPTIPQLYVGGEFIGGCDIIREMHAKGELATALLATQ